MFLNYPNFFRKEIIEAPIKLRRKAKEPYVIPKGTVFKFKGRAVETIKDELIVPNNRFRYLDMKPASLSFHVKHFFKMQYLKLKHFILMQFYKRRR